MSVKTVTIKMLETTSGSDNELGKYRPKPYKKDVIYTVGSDLAKSFIDQKAAKIATKAEAAKAAKAEGNEEGSDANDGDEDEGSDDDKDEDGPEKEGLFSRMKSKITGKHSNKQLEGEEDK